MVKKHQNENLPKFAPDKKAGNKSTAKNEKTKFDSGMKIPDFAENFDEDFDMDETEDEPGNETEEQEIGFPSEISNKKKKSDKDGIVTGGAAFYGPDMWGKPKPKKNDKTDKKLSDNNTTEKPMSDKEYKKLSSEFKEKTDYPYGKIVKGTNEKSMTSAIKPGTYIDYVKNYDNESVRCDNQMTVENIIKQNSTFLNETKNKLKDFIKKEENIQLKAYKVGKDKWTIGYGHTENVKPGDVITEKEAERLLEDDINKHIVALKAVKVPLTENQKIALASLAFNRGVYGFKKSDMVKYLNENNFEKAGAEFDLIVNSADGKQDGLVSRRQKEKELFGK